MGGICQAEKPNQKSIIHRMPLQAVNESHLKTRVLSVGKKAQQLWGAAGYQALPGGWQKRERAKRHHKLHLASQHCYCRAIDPLQMNSIFCSAHPFWTYSSLYTLQPHMLHHLTLCSMTPCFGT
ncbi:hypothetical protein AMECASPLE_000239 [Ameca splendens]|uniref:Uncharacterized protein n=1 Tax=Ameca splendens TaxID=208324 RepID=A0ABV0ZIH0_9TELE